MAARKRPFLVCGMDTAQLHFGAAIIEYTPPDEAPIMSAKRKNAEPGSEKGPRLQGERVRLLGARFMDLKRGQLLVSYEAGKKRVIQLPVGNASNDLNIQLINLSRLLHDWDLLVNGKRQETDDGDEAMQRGPPPSPPVVVIENPNVGGGGGDKRAANSYPLFAIASAPLSLIAEFDLQNGRQPRKIVFGQSKVGVPRNTPGKSERNSYSALKKMSIDQWRATMERQGDKDGLALFDAMARVELKRDDIADAYNLAHQYARDMAGVTDVWLRNLEETNRRRGYK